MKEHNKKEFSSYGLPLWLAAGTSAIVFASAVAGSLTMDLAGNLAFMMAIGMFFNEIGTRIPIWNKYAGGGLMLAFLASSFLATYGLIPNVYLKGSQVIMEDINFLSFFIIFVITGSILSLDRKLFLRSLAGYVPAMLGAIAGAAILGCMAGNLCGIPSGIILAKYLLPIMGGGNGTGAVPLSQIYETVTQHPASQYYSFAIMILTIGNVAAIIGAALLEKLGKWKPELTGDGNRLFRYQEDLVILKDQEKSSVEDLGGAFFLSVSLYALAQLFSKIILPNVFGVPIHPFAWLILLVSLVAAAGLIPENICEACRQLQSFFSSNILVIIMAGVGLNTNIITLVEMISLKNIITAIAIVLGAALGSALIGWLAGFYPIDAAITAGLCMANRGGSGDLAVLSASKRMGLITYAQLSSRLGGGIVLILGSILISEFAEFL